MISEKFAGGDQSGLAGELDYLILPKFIPTGGKRTGLSLAAAVSH